MNLWDILIVALLAAAVVLSVLRLRRKHGGCSCGCESCAERNNCRRR